MLLPYSGNCSFPLYDDMISPLSSQTVYTGPPMLLKRQFIGFVQHRCDTFSNEYSCSDRLCLSSCLCLCEYVIVLDYILLCIEYNNWSYTATKKRKKQNSVCARPYQWKNTKLLCIVEFLSLFPVLLFYPLSYRLNFFKSSFFFFVFLRSQCICVCTGTTIG